MTSVRDLAMVRPAVSAGVAQYPLKPFTFATRAKLERYARFHSTLGRSGEAADQEEVDRALATLRSPGARRYLEYLVDHGYAERVP